VKINAGKFLRISGKLLRDRETRSFALTLAAAALVIAASYYAVERYSARKNYPEREIKMSVFNSGSSGTMALREFLERMGLPTGKVLRSLDRFDLEAAGKGNGAKSRGLLVIFEPEVPLQKKEVRMFVTLAEQGFSVLAASAGEEKMAGILHTLSSEKFSKVRGGMYLDDVPSAVSTGIRSGDIIRGVGSLDLPGKKRFRTWHRDWEVLVRDRYGVIALVKRVGQGRIVLVSDGEFASNSRLGKGDNGLFAYLLAKNLAGGGPVHFDEYHHGYSRRFTLLYFLARREYLAVVVQTLLFFTLLAAAAWVRFGQVLKPRTEGNEGTIFYFTRGMAGLLEGRRHRAGLASLMVSNFKKMNAHARDAQAAERLRRAEELLRTRGGKAPGRRTLKALFTMVRGDDNGNKGIR
jgi:hypothetical protein